MRSRTVLFAFALILCAAGTADAKSYSADRFDSRIQVLPGGDIEVTETVVFRFDGTFSEVFRSIPRRRTDGIDILRASMNGQALPVGKEAGHYDVTHKDGNIHVRWHFAPVTDATRTFELTYVARGVVQQDERGDLFAWRALPREHNYAIAATTITVELPVEPAVPPDVRTDRVGSAHSSVSGTTVTVDAGNIRTNGWLEVATILPAGSVIAAAPAWQQQQIRGRQLAPTFLLTSGIVFIAGLVLLLAVRQGYDSPNVDKFVTATGPTLPDQHPPAIAGALASNGSIGVPHAMATLFALAERGEIQIEERPKSWGQRQFTVRRTPTGARLTSSEEILLSTTFKGRHGIEDTVDLAKARSRVFQNQGKFSAAVTAEMQAAGLIDDGRRTVRRRFQIVAIAALLSGVIGLLICALAIQQYGPLTLFIPAASLVVGVIGLIMFAAHTPLSNEGLRRGRDWRGFKHYVRDVTRDRATVSQEAATRLLPFAVAVGLAQGWSTYLKKHRGNVPQWFRAIGPDGGAEAFPYFVYSGGAGTGHGAGGAGGGAAGGGASGAH